MPGIPDIFALEAKFAERTILMTDELEDFPQWRDEIETRVGTLEVTVETEAPVRAKMDQDMSDLKLEFRAQRSMLQALHETQSDHTANLRDHTAMLREHTAMLREHGGILREHGGILRDHTAILREHGGRLGRLEAGQAKMLAGVQTIIGLLDKETGQTAE